MAITMDQIHTETGAVPSEDAPGLPFSFHGRAGEYFGIWIVNLLLSIVTLGIYSAWAKVRTKRYFYGNTHLDGSAFAYLASPLQILKGRLIMFAFFATYAILTSILPTLAWPFLAFMFLITPWAVVRARAFNAHNSAYRNVRFGFTGRIVDAFKLYVLWPIASLLTLGGLWPYSTYLADRFFVDHSRYGQAEMTFAGRPGAYYRIYGFALFLAWPAVLLALAFIALGLYIGTQGLAGDPAETERVMAELGERWLTPIVGLLPIWILIAIPLGIAASAYLTVYRQNYLFNNTRVGPHRLRLNLTLGRVLWIRFTNLIVIALSFGLMIPWAQIRMARYQIGQMSLVPEGDLDTLVGEQQAKVGAYGDEMGEGMDLDLGLGV